MRKEGKKCMNRFMDMIHDLNNIIYIYIYIIIHIIEFIVIL